MLEKVLEEYWFSNRESKVYLANLELWESLASSIARKSWQNRVSTYSILSELKKQGIVKEITKNTVKYFSVVSPQVLEDNQKNKLSKLQKVMPELLALSNGYWNRPKVFFYEWFENTKQVFYDIINNGPWDWEDFYTFLWTQKISSDFEKFFIDDFLPFRIKSKDKTKTILFDKNPGYSQQNSQLHENVIIKDQIFEMENEIILYDNKIAFLSYNDTETYALILESNTLYKSLKSIFSLVWNTYKK